MSKYTLYGDGIHDDTEAIQELLDTGKSMVELLVPEEKYLISRTLLIGSHQTLKLPDTATIRLMDNSNCLMLRNRNWHDYDEDIAVVGGIWDLNDLGQEGNPLQKPHDIVDWQTGDREYNDRYFGVIMRFSHVKRLRVSNVTLKDPVTFAIQAQRIEYFTFENINFDFAMRDPHPMNTDGIHLDGFCKYGFIQNLKGRCYDDLVALNANDCGGWGEISNIRIDGIYAENCHSAVRLLTTESLVKNISISNVYGTYYQYGIGLTYFHNRTTRGRFENITIDNVFISKAPRPEYLIKWNHQIYAPIYIDGKLDITKVVINNVNRTETALASELIMVGRETCIDNLSLTDIYQDSDAEFARPVLLNNGKIETLYMRNVYNKDYEVTDGDGTVNKRI